MGIERDEKRGFVKRDRRVTKVLWSAPINASAENLQRSKANRLFRSETDREK